MSNYRIFRSVYVNEYGKEKTPYFWIKKRKTQIKQIKKQK